MKHFKKIVLKNGLRLILVPQPAGLAASVLILVEAGSEYEAKKINGLSHFLEHMVFKGTENRPRPGMIAEELTALGSQYNAFTTQEYTGYWAKVAAHKLPKILEIVSDLYLHPLFAPEEIEKERGVVIEEMNMYEDMPMRRIQDHFLKLLYGDQPAGWKVDGEKEVVRRLMREDFLKYRAERYAPKGTVVVVAGKFNEKEVVAQVKKTFGGLKRRELRAKTKTRERQAKPQLMLKFKESDQGHLVLGFRAFDIFDKRRFAIQVLADILGGGMSSRLWKKVREELGAAYYIHSDAELFIDHGVMGVSAGVDHSKIEVVIKAILDECAKMRDELVPPEELKRAKDHITGHLILELETSDQLAGFYGAQEVATREPLQPDAIVSRINGITAEEVRSVARDLFKNKKLNLAIIGPYRNEAIFQKILRL